MISLIWILLCLSLVGTLTFYRNRLKSITVCVGLFLLAWTLLASQGWGTMLAVWIVYVAITTALHYRPLRKRWLSGPALNWFRETLPELSETERTALDAGTIGWESELFSGMPDWQQLERLPPPRLGQEEQAFIDGPLHTLLGHITDTIHADAGSHPLPIDKSTWNQLKTGGFFGLAIPIEFGGLGFSAYARSCILAQVGTAPGGPTLGPIIAATNALGPAQLLLACGTAEQKAHYLPRLASGNDIPCFAVTSERAGTDAAALTDQGVICERQHDGKLQLGVRLDWHKRHITLAPVATLIGLAVQVHDPDRLLGNSVKPGMTCLLVPADTSGVDNSQYHQPVGAAFPYGTTEGRDVFVPLDAIIGGIEMIGHGWQLLMEYLPTGRAISTPSAASGLCTSSARLAGAYARIRSQFGHPIGSFEGVEEILARMGGQAYACEAVRRLAANAVDLGERPAIAAAIAKYHCTTRAQQVATDSMTLHAGKAACAGPNNPIAANYAAAPLAATLDGTNLFTRSMLILGQGSIRCHPFLQAEIRAAARPDPQNALNAFDAVFPTHLGHIVSIAVRSLALGISGGRGSNVGNAPDMQRHQQRINRYSAALALLADFAMVVTGDNLRYRENLSGRLGDVLSELYIASAVVQRYRQDGAHQSDLHAVEWVCEDCFATIEKQLAKILRYLPRRPAAWLVRVLIFPLGRHADGPSDECSHRVSTILQTPGNTRNRLTPHCYVQPGAEHGMALFDTAIQATTNTAALRKRLRRAIRRGELQGTTPADCMDAARDINLLDAVEHEQLRHAYALHDAVIRVDTFRAATNSRMRATA